MPSGRICALYPRAELLTGGGDEEAARRWALRHRLLGTFTTAEAARAWLNAANRYLGGLTPADALRVGRLDRVEAALEALDSGVFI
ncbi:MAG: MbcA/ParS/Xre antitoxin family protein [Chloroflexota bacterium]